jgi:hypothetical protein
MYISDFELIIIKRFHDEFFTYQALKKFRKPDLDTFIENEKLKKSSFRYKLILSLYFFKFWSLAYIVKAPSSEFIRSVFKSYIDKP